jgi:hypothetical protein
MDIVQPPRSPRHPAPRELRPIAGARGIGDGYFEIVRHEVARCERANRTEGRVIDDSAPG